VGAEVVTRRFTPEEDARIQELRAQGLEYAEIARVLGEDYWRIRDRAVKYLGPPPPREHNDALVIELKSGTRFVTPYRRLTEVAA
jgi:hypothetical protein